MDGYYKAIQYILNFLKLLNYKLDRFSGSQLVDVTVCPSIHPSEKK